MGKLPLVVPTENSHRAMWLTLTGWREDEVEKKVWPNNSQSPRTTTLVEKGIRESWNFIIISVTVRKFTFLLLSIEKKARRHGRKNFKRAWFYFSLHDSCTRVSHFHFRHFHQAHYLHNPFTLFFFSGGVWEQRHPFLWKYALLKAPLKCLQELFRRRGDWKS